MYPLHRIIRMGIVGFITPVKEKEREKKRQLSTHGIKNIPTCMFKKSMKTINVEIIK